MEPRPQDPGLDAHFVAQGDRTAIGHLPAEPPPLEHDDLIAPGDGEGLQEHDQSQGCADERWPCGRELDELEIHVESFLGGVDGRMTYNHHTNVMIHCPG